MNYSYEYYRIFYYVARYLNLSKAAKVLSISQPNISRTIKKLESGLGCELFVRTNSGVLLTKQGETLYKHVREAHRELSVGEAEIIADMDSVKRNISIGFSIGISNNIIELNIIPPIGQFNRDYPETHLLIVNKPTPELISDVREGLLDMAIITSSIIQNPEALKERILLRFRDTVITGSKYRDAFRAPVSFSYILEFPIIGFARNTETYALYDHICAAKGYDYHVNIEVTNHDQALVFVQNNIGLGCIPEYMAEPAIKAGSVFMINTTDRLPQRRVSIFRNEQTGNIAAELLEDYIIKYSAK